MNLLKISIQNIKLKPLYTALSVFILALSISLLLGIQQLKNSFEYQIDNNLGDVQLVIGAKGSPLQLVLSSVLHLDNPTGNIKYEKVKKLAKHPFVKKAVPISYGDNFKGYRIVGTTNQFSAIYNAEIADGRSMEASMEVVLGSQIAQKLKLKIGDTFASSHGLIEEGGHVHDDEFLVVGIYKPTQKVIDRLIITPLESVWDVHEGHDHDHEHGESCSHHHEEEDREITSMLMSFKNPGALLTIPRNINENTNMQAALPKYQLDKLYEFTGVGFQTISWIAYIILFISCMIIFTSVYKMVKERAFDFALMRTYGAKNYQLILIMLYEGMMVVSTAFIIGILATRVGLQNIMDSFGGDSMMVLQELPMNDLLHIGALVFFMILFSVLLAIYPILRMNISTILSNEK